MDYTEIISAVIALISFVLFFVAIRLSPYRREQHAAKKS